MSVYMPLDCDGFAAALADYLEGDAPDAVRAAVEAHAEECAECGALLADLRAIPVQAAALPALTPSRDLWSGIAERIDARVLPLERPAARTIVPARRSWARPAVAAAAIAGRAQLRRAGTIVRVAVRSIGNTRASMRSAIPLHRSRDGVSTGSAAACRGMACRSASSALHSAHSSACASTAARTASGASPSR